MPDISKTYTSFWQGISDDNFIWSENSIQDMDWIDVQSEERYAKIDWTYKVSEDYLLTWGATWFKNTTSWNFISNLTNVQYSWSNLALSGTAWDWMEVSWSWVNQQNYFFERTSGVKISNYNGSTIGSFLTTGYPTSNIAITAIWWHQSNILFAKDNLVYFFSTVTNTTTLATTLMPWTVVLHTHTINMNSIILVCKNGTTTIVYELEFTGWAYNKVSEVKDNDFVVIWAIGNNYDVFLIWTAWLWQYQWRQIQQVKYFTLTTNAKISYDKWIIISDWGNIYKFSKNKPWRSYILTKNEFTATLVSNWVLLLNVSGWYKTYYKSTGFKRSNTVILRPLDWGIYEIPKHDLSYRIGFINPEWNGTPETDKCWVKIEVQTDEMEKDISTLYVTVFEEYEDFLWYRDITPQELAKAIETAGYKSQFWYARTRVTLYAGNKVWTLYTKTPKLFDLTINANYVKR